MKTLTLSQIREWGPCYDPSDKLPETWKGTILDILDMENVDIEDRVWCGVKYLNESNARLFACWCARQALKLLPPEQPDKRSWEAIRIAERFARGKATKQELAAARAAARAAQLKKLRSVCKAQMEGRSV